MDSLIDQSEDRVNLALSDRPIEKLTQFTVVKGIGVDLRTDLHVGDTILWRSGIFLRFEKVWGLQRKVSQVFCLDWLYCAEAKI
jgi:hypothetical protein